MTPSADPFKALHEQQLYSALSPIITAQHVFCRLSCEQNVNYRETYFYIFVQYHHLFVNTDYIHRLVLGEVQFLDLMPPTALNAGGWKQFLRLSWDKRFLLFMCLSVQTFCQQLLFVPHFTTAFIFQQLKAGRDGKQREGERRPREKRWRVKRREWDSNFPERWWCWWKLEEKAVVGRGRGRRKSVLRKYAPLLCLNVNCQSCREKGQPLTHGGKNNPTMRKQHNMDANACFRPGGDKALTWTGPCWLTAVWNSKLHYT